MMLEFYKVMGEFFFFLCFFFLFLFLVI